MSDVIVIVTSVFKTVVFFYINNYNLCSTNPCRCKVIWRSISQNDDDVRYVTAVTCHWSQHRCTNKRKCSRRVSVASWVSKWWNGWSKWDDRRIRVEINRCSDVCGISDETHACVAAVNIQSADKPWQKWLHQSKIVCTDTTRCIQHENDVNRTIRLRSCNNCVLSIFILSQQDTLVTKNRK